jgi:hypothetical protein
MQNIEVNSVYKHYKGNYYKVLNIAIHTETDEKMVIYQALYGENLIWCRPASIWNDRVEFNGENIKRFELIKDYYGKI